MRSMSVQDETQDDSAFTLCQDQVRKQGASSAGRSLHRAAGAAAQQPHRPRRSRSFDSLDLQLTQQRRLDDRMHCMLRAMLARPITRTASHARLCSFGTKAPVQCALMRPVLNSTQNDAKHRALGLSRQGQGMLWQSWDNPTFDLKPINALWAIRPSIGLPS